MVSHWIIFIIARIISYTHFIKYLRQVDFAARHINALSGPRKFPARHFTARFARVQELRFEDAEVAKSSRINKLGYGYASPAP